MTTAGGAQARPTREEVARLIASVGVWYHVLELAPGLETPGVYDMRPFVDRYGFPGSLAGRDVLDVGAASGFFSFCFERLGARRVVATNLASYAQHDYPRAYLERVLAGRTAEELACIDHHESTGGLEVARRCLGSRVEHVLTPVRSLAQALDARFDFAFFGSVLMHLRDPVGGLESIRQVLKPGGELVVATQMDTTAPEQSYALFLGKPEQVAWWVPSRAGLERMCALAGFEGFQWTGSFVLSSRHGHVDTIGVASMVRP